MRLRPILLFAAIALIGFSGTAMAEEMVDNPAYKAWASYKPGTSVTRKMNTEMSMNNMKMESTMTQKLLEVTAEKVVVETAMENGMPRRGGLCPMAPHKADIPAKIEKSKLDSALASDDGKAKVTNVKDGTDTVEVKGTKLDAKTKDMDVEMEKEGMKMTGHIKQWLTDTIPGGNARMVVNNKIDQGEMSMDMTVTTTVTDYKVEK